MRKWNTSGVRNSEERLLRAEMIGYSFPSTWALIRAGLGEDGAGRFGGQQCLDLLQSRGLRLAFLRVKSLAMPGKGPGVERVG